MTKAVLTSKVSPTYDDLPEERYHFPRAYLRQIEAAKGDWVVYYEPRRTTGDLSSRGGRQAYFATARIRNVAVDPTTEDHFYAFIEDYLAFENNVPFAENGFYYEKALVKEDGSTNKGAFGRAVRNLSDQEYDLIVQAGFSHILHKPDVASTAPHVPTAPEGFADAGNPLFGSVEEFESERAIVEQLISRPFRDRAFATAVKAAYHDTCAITGLKIINGGGRSEVQAAHIRPVSDDGPDSIRNGVALSGTFHWMFDRGLLSIDDDLKILVAEGRVPDTVDRLIVRDRKLIAPTRPDLQPHKNFLRYHRNNVFRG